MIKLPRKAIHKETFKKNTIRDMKHLGVYKPEYDPVIGIYSEIYEQYQLLTSTYKSSGYSDTTTARRIETLRRDFITYSDRLCLNPKANDTVKIESSKGSRLESALAKLENQ